MMAIPENSTAERNCQTLGRCREEGESQSLLPPPSPQGPPLCSQDARTDWTDVGDEMGCNPGHGRMGGWGGGGKSRISPDTQLPQTRCVHCSPEPQRLPDSKLELVA